MTKKEIIYNALGMIEGAVCVSQKNTRDVLMKAINMIKNSIEEDTGCECNHDWEAKEIFDGCDVTDSYNINRYTKYVCKLCGKVDFRKE